MPKRATRRKAENAVQAHLRPHLRDPLRALATFDGIFRAAAIELRRQPDTSVAEALSTLAYRLASDLRACALLFERNYRAQAMTLGASVMECALTVRHIDFRPELARLWVEHKSLDKAPWSVSRLIRSVGKESHTLDRSFYEIMAAAKHHNPRVLKGLVRAKSLDEYRLESDVQVETNLPAVLSHQISLILAAPWEAARYLAESGRLSSIWVARLRTADRRQARVIRLIFDAITKALNVGAS